MTLARTLTTSKRAAAAAQLDHPDASGMRICCTVQHDLLTPLDACGRPCGGGEAGGVACGQGAGGRSCCGVAGHGRGAAARPAVAGLPGGPAGKRARSAVDMTLTESVILDGIPDEMEGGRCNDSAGCGCKAAARPAVAELPGGAAGKTRNVLPKLFTSWRFLCEWAKVAAAPALAAEIAWLALTGLTEGHAGKDRCMYMLVQFQEVYTTELGLGQRHRRHQQWLRSSGRKCVNNHNVMP